MNINKEILLTIVKNSSNRLEGEQEIIEINEQQLNIVCKKLTELFSLHVVSQQSELLFCDFCKEDSPHRKHEHKKMKECEGCGLITKL